MVIIEGAWEAEGLRAPDGFRRLLVHDDPVLRACMARLASGNGAADVSADLQKDEAAHALLLRLAHLDGGTTPDWHADESSFDGSVLRSIVTFMDANLRSPPALHEWAAHVGLSPSHFARKFRRSTGLSLHRFLNRRRLIASLSLLQDQSLAIAPVAFSLGFSSQRHFTRLFSELTGMTPARYRKQFRRTSG